VSGTGVPRLYRGDGVSSFASVDGSSSFRAGTYVVAGFEMAGTTATHYLNGQEKGSGTITAKPMDGGNALKVGSRHDMGNNNER
jgi:hypothetical protein